MVSDSIEVAKEVRDRYTLLQLLWDLGILKTVAEETAASFLKEMEKLRGIDGWRNDMQSVWIMELFP